LEKCQLLHGPHHSPHLSRGDCATCILRDGDVVITGWSNGRIAWPRCKVVGVRGGSGVLLDEELARAVKQESAAAIFFWRRVSEGVVWRCTRLLT